MTIYNTAVVRRLAKYGIHAVKPTPEPELHSMRRHRPLFIGPELPVYEANRINFDLFVEARKKHGRRPYDELI